MLCEILVDFKNMKQENNSNIQNSNKGINLQKGFLRLMIVLTISSSFFLPVMTPHQGLLNFNFLEFLFYFLSIPIILWLIYFIIIYIVKGFTTKNNLN